MTNSRLFNMQYEDVLNYLFKKLHFSSEEKSITLSIYRVVLQVFERVRPARVRNVDHIDVNANDRIEVCQQNLQLIIDHFASYGTSCEEFKKNFRRWENKRIENYEHLSLLAASLYETRTICNISKVVSGSVGAAGGTATVLSLAVAAPVLLPIIGSVTVAVAGLASALTSVVEHTELKEHLEKAKKICEVDNSDFHLLGEWLRQSAELKRAVDALVDFDVLEEMFRHLSNLRRERARLSANCSDLVTAIKTCALIACSGGTYLLFELGTATASVVVTTLVAMVLFHRRTPSILHTSKLGLGAVSGIVAAVEVGKLIAATGGQAAAKLVPAALSKKVACGAVAGLGVAVDVTRVVLSSIELAKGEACEEGQMIVQVAEMLEGERRVLRNVYDELTSGNRS